MGEWEWEDGGWMNGIGEEYWALAWASALKFTDAKLDLLTDPDAYLTIENNERGYRDDN